MTRISVDSTLLPVNLGIVGFGFVGQAVAFGFNKASRGKDQILYFDKFKDSPPLKEVIDQSEFIFICLPTPMKANEGGIDLSIIDHSMEEITSYTNATDKVVIIKSTVVPGTTAKYEKRYPQTHFVFNPEFLTEANYLEEFLHAPKTIIGANSDLDSRRVAMMYRQRFPKTEIFQTDPTTAETVKYFANAFLATKVTFANFFYDFCQKIGIKYEEVKKMAATDPRIGDKYLEVTSARGFGQKCLPKDLVALIGEFRRNKIDSSFFETIWEYNKKVRKVHDWEEVPFAVEGNVEGKNKRVDHNHKVDYQALNKLIYKQS